MRRHLLAFAPWILALASTTGCTPRQLVSDASLPDVGPTEAEVVRAAIDAVEARYPMSTPVRRSRLVFAETPVGLDATYPSKKQITVRILRTYTGYWVPRVRVLQFVDTGEPTLDAQPDSRFPGLAHPLADHDWTAITYLHAEARELHDAILAGLRSPAPSDSGDEPEGASEDTTETRVASAR